MYFVIIKEYECEIILKRTGTKTRIHRSSCWFDPSRRRLLLNYFMQLKLFWHTKDYTYTWASATIPTYLFGYFPNSLMTIKYAYGPTLLKRQTFELDNLRHRVEPIGLAHSQCHVLLSMTVIARRWEPILVWASQEAAKGQTKSRTLARWANSLGPIKCRINTRFLSIYNLNLKHYWFNTVPITSCLLWSCITRCTFTTTKMLHQHLNIK